VNFSDNKLFAALAKAAERWVGEFNEQGLASTAWAFAMVGEPALAIPHSIALLGASAVQGESELAHY